MQNITKRLIRWSVAIALLLLIPLVLTIRDGGVEGVGWNWTLGDFIFAFVLIFGVGSLFELARRKAAGNTAYKFAAGLALAGVFFLVWINAAVGIIGDGDLDSPNGMYFGVLAIGFIGSAITRLKPRGLSYTLFAMAIAQALVPVIALIVNPSNFAPSVAGVFALNSIFVMLFAGSGLLFRQASTTASM